MPPPERTKKKGVKIVWFGVSERGPKLKTTLHGDLLLMADKYICSLWPAKRLDWTDHGIGLNRSWDWIGPIMGLDWTVNGLNFLWTLMDSLEVS